MDFFFIFDFKSLFKYLMKQKVIRKPPSLLLVLLSKSSKSLDHMLWKEYTVYSEWRLAIRRHSALLADSSQLIADSFYLLTVSLTMTPYHPRSFWTDARMLCKKAGKRNRETEWRIYYSDDISHGFFRTPLSYSLSNLCMQKGLTSLQVLFLYQQLPILPGRFRPSTFGVCELNFRVRHGYGWSSQLSPLFLWETVLSKPYRRSPEVIRLSRCF